jgi:hypothetical protein
MQNSVFRFWGFIVIVAPRTDSGDGRNFETQARLSVAPVGSAHEAPKSPVRITRRLRLETANPVVPTNHRSEIWPCIGWGGKLQVAPPSKLRRMNPPPPASTTESGDWTQTAFTSDFESIRSGTGCH